MLCVPAARLLVLQPAVFEFAVPVGSATALQPLSVVPSAVKATLPVGAEPLTVAVKVTFAPTVDGLAELLSVVSVAPVAAAANAVRWFDPSVAYTTPLATIKLSQWKPLERARLHNTLPDSGSSARTVLPLIENTILLATMGDVPPWPFCHRDTSDGLPLTSKTNCRPEAPLLLTIKTQVVASAGFTHTAGCVRTTPPCGTLITAPTSPPT